MLRSHLFKSPSPALVPVPPTSKSINILFRVEFGVKSFKNGEDETARRRIAVVVLPRLNLKGLAFKIRRRMSCGNRQVQVVGGVRGGCLGKPSRCYLFTYRSLSSSSRQCHQSRSTQNHNCYAFC